MGLMIFCVLPIPLREQSVPGSVTFTTPALPNGTTVWGAGTTQKIEWTKTFTEYVDLELSRTVELVTTIWPITTNKDGLFHDWVVPTGLTDATNYVITATIFQLMAALFSPS